MKIPEPTLRRLPWYLAYVKMAQQQGETYISSTQIAQKIGIDASQVAKDFSYLDIAGKTRVGYQIDVLVALLNSRLGFGNSHKAVLFGAGSLGSSLLHDNGLEQYGLKIVAAFDVRPELIGREIHNIPILHVDDFLGSQQQINSQIGVLTVPVEHSQEVADLMIAGGVRAIWNFTPYRVRVPENIVLQNASIYSQLALLYNHLSEIIENEIG